MPSLEVGLGVRYLLLVVFFLGIGSAGPPPVARAEIAVPDEPNIEPCVPRGSEPFQLLELAQEEKMVVASFPNHIVALRIHVSSVFSAEEAGINASLKRPFNLTGPVHIIRGVAENGKATLMGYVRCDFFTGQISSSTGQKVNFGERPDARPHDPLIRGPSPLAPNSSYVPPPLEVETAPHGSVHVSKHAWGFDSDWNWVPSDPVNVVFYDVLGDTIAHALAETGYDGVCAGDAKDVAFYDQMHGATDSWLQVQRQWEKPDRPCAHGVRQHMREYISHAPEGDNHDPPFQGYAAMPIHRDDDGGPQRGQDYFLWDFYGNHHVLDYHELRVPTSPGDCSACNQWDGWIDLYEVSANDPVNPGGTDKNCDWVDSFEYPLGTVRVLMLRCNKEPSGSGDGILDLVDGSGQGCTNEGGSTWHCMGRYVSSRDHILQDTHLGTEVSDGWGGWADWAAGLSSDQGNPLGVVVYDGCTSPLHTFNNLPASDKNTNRDWPVCTGSGWSLEMVDIVDDVFGQDISGFACVDLNSDGTCGSNADGEFGTGFCSTADPTFIVPNFANAMVYFVDGPLLQPVDCPGTSNGIGGTSGTVHIWITPTNSPACADGLDNDGDGYTDWGYGAGWPDRGQPWWGGIWQGNLGGGCDHLSDNTE